MKGVTGRQALKSPDAPSGESPSQANRYNLFYPRRAGWEGLCPEVR